MPKGGGVTDQKRLEIAERRKMALEMRLAGRPYREIAKIITERTGTKVSHSTLVIDVAECLKDIPKQAAEELRQQEVERLDRLQSAVWTKALKGNLGAVDRAVRIIDRRAKMLGLDAPEQVELSMGDVDLDGTVEKLLRAAELAVQTKDNDEADE